MPIPASIFVLTTSLNRKCMPGFQLHFLLSVMKAGSTMYISTNRSTASTNSTPCRRQFNLPSVSSIPLNSSSFLPRPRGIARTRSLYRRFRCPEKIPITGNNSPVYILVHSLFCNNALLAWFETLKNGPWLVRDFTRYQVHLFSQPGAGHSGFPGYHIVVNLFGVFPVSIISLPALFYPKPAKGYQRSFRLWMIIFFRVVIILFSIVRLKIIPYSSITYFPLTFLSALTIHETIRSRYSWKNWVNVLLVIVGLLPTLLVAITPLAGLDIQEILSRFTNNTHALQSVEFDVQWHAWEIIFGLAAMSGVITFVVFTRRQNILTGYIILLLTMAFMNNGLANRFYPKILWYSQGPQLEFFKSLQGQDCYITTLGYKSYAHYFYRQMEPQDNPRKQDWHLLLTGDIDKTAYFSAQRADLEKFMWMSDGIELIGTKGRFAFLKRSPE